MPGLLEFILLSLDLVGELGYYKPGLFESILMSLDLPGDSGYLRLTISFLSITAAN